jgi:hypothetical protein
MATLIKSILFLVLLGTFFGTESQANTITATTCNSSDVQSAINSSSGGDTVIIPAGKCTWTSSVTIAGKGIHIQGAGSGRIIAYDNGIEVLAIGTGIRIVAIAGFSPGFSSASIASGQVLRISQNNNRGNWMQGTVTAIVGNLLTMNITSTNGAVSTHRWLVSTVPQTTIVDNSSSGIFSITEDTTNHTSLSGIKIAQGTVAAGYIGMNYAAGGQAILIHDNWFEQSSAGGELINSNTNRGVIWNNSFDGSNNGSTNLDFTAAVRIKIPNPQSGQNAWTAASFWGMSDTGGVNNLYVETNDFHAFQAVTDNDDNGRMVFRYNLVDHAEFATHGADTSPYGQRYFEYYNNVGNFNGYADGTTFNLANSWIGLVRGGTFIAHDNTLPPIVSQDFTKGDILMTVFNLQEGSNNPSDACWGAGTTAGTTYHAPRQVGFGRVTGTGLDGKKRSTDETTYVGDSEPIYIWNNNRTFTVGITDFGGTHCSNPDTSRNYIVLNRDYSLGTAKPGYTPYTYPHPLAQGSTATGNSVAAPTNLTVGAIQ